MGDLALLFEEFKNPSRRETQAGDEGCLNFSDETDDFKATNIEDGVRPLAIRSAPSEDRKTPIMLHCELCQYEVSEKETSELNCKHRF